MHRSIVSVALVVGLSPFYLGADAACRRTPGADSIVVTDSIRVAGSLRDETNTAVDAEVTLRVNGVPLPPANTVSAQFDFPNVPLAVGPNVIEGTSRRLQNGSLVLGEIPPVRVERKTDLFDRGSQSYFLDFRDPAYRAEVIDFISRTVSTPISAADADRLFAQVNARIRERFLASYEERGLRIFEVGALGTGVSRVLFDGTQTRPDGRFGEAPLDYRNLRREQTATVFVPSIRSSFVDRSAIFLATPARRSDTPERRALDLGNILSRVGIHELGHTLGLVASGPQQLDGCEGAHNCPSFDDQNPLANRFQLGDFFMDARRTAAADFGSRSPTMRIEFFPVFNNYNRAYLGIIH